MFPKFPLRLGAALVPCGLLVAALAFAPAEAQTSPPNPNPGTAPAAGATPAASPTPQPQHFNGALGDLDGARAKLAKNGFTFNGHIVSEFAANVTGGKYQGGGQYMQGTALSTEVGLGFDYDLGVTHPGAGIIHALATTRFGSSLASNDLGNAAGSVQEIYGDGQTTRITFLTYEQPIAHNHVSLELGKYNQQNDFIAGPSYWGGNLYCFYQNNNICGTPAGIPINNGVTPAGTAGYNYYPSSMWGGRLKIAPSNSFYIEAAALQVNPIVNSNIGGAYFGFYGDTGTELPVEIGFTQHDEHGNAIGNFKVGGYFDTSNVESYIDRLKGFSIPGSTTNALALNSLPISFVRGREGADVQLDHLIAGSAAPGKHGLAAFATFEYSDPNTSLLTTFYTAGLVQHGTFASRPNDSIALGYADAQFNPRLENLELAFQAAGYDVPYTSSEKAIELNYGYQANSFISLRPNVQYVIDPSGEQQNIPVGLTPPKNALVLGLQGVITF